jgi:hypothetical protein
MRACFLGQHVCVLGYGVATLQLPPLPQPAQLPKRKAVIVEYKARKKHGVTRQANQSEQKLAS